MAITLNGTTGITTPAIDNQGNLTVDGGTIKLDGNYPVGSDNVALGNTALDSNVSGSTNVALGSAALTALNSGNNNHAIGQGALQSNVSGGENVAIGRLALQANTASSNTTIGHNAGYTSTTGNYNTLVGRAAGLALTSGSANTFVGGYDASTGGSGAEITTGSNNTILGTYNGNQGGLDIRTSSNNIVLSDGDGNPLLYNDGTNWTSTGNSFSLKPATTINASTLICSNTGGSLFFGIDNSAGSTFGQGAYQRNIYSGSASYKLYVTANSNGVYLAVGGTSWTANSDERLKENLVPIDDAVNKVASLRAVTGNLIADKDKKSRAFLIAQDVQAVLPEAVDASDPEKLGVQYTEVIPLLVAAIKEQQATITALTARITALEGN